MVTGKIFSQQHVPNVNLAIIMTEILPIKDKVNQSKIYNSIVGIHYSSLYSV